MEPQRKLFLATRNVGKVAELAVLLKDLPIHLVTPDAFEALPEVVEDADTLEGNAQKKAEILAAYTGLSCLADDTGLEVEALQGAPGVYSARFAGADATDADNRAALLFALQGVKNRRAHFRTVIAWKSKHTLRFFEGVCKGSILEAERGSGGFGYDSLFVPDGEGRSFAQMSKEEKNKISHRGKALQEFASYIRSSSER